MEPFDRYLRANDSAGSPLRDCLRPGLKEWEVKRRLTDLGLEPHDDVIAIYSWHDGVDQEAWRQQTGDQLLYFAPGVFFPSLEEAVADYAEIVASLRQLEQLDDYVETLAPGAEFWRAEWFPVFQRDFVRYAVDCVKGHGQVLAVFLQAPPHEVAYANLGAMITTLAERFETGGYYWSQTDREYQRRPDAPPV